MCEVSKDIIMQDLNSLKQFVVYWTIIVAALSILVCVLFIVELSKPVDGMVNSLYQKASYDTLSGVLNKASFENVAKDIMASEKSSKSQYSFIMIDMDNFKSINDTLGHSVGDDVISRMGEMLLAYLKTDNTHIGRLGGDEFAIFYTAGEKDRETVQKRVGIKLSYLREAFAAEFAKEKEKLNISLSIGVSDSFSVDKDFEALYKAADSALYEAKHAGKDQIIFFEKEVAKND